MVKNNPFFRLLSLRPSLWLRQTHPEREGENAPAASGELEFGSQPVDAKRPVQNRKLPL